MSVIREHLFLEATLKVMKKSRKRREDSVKAVICLKSLRF